MTPRASRFVDLPDPFAMRRGGVLRGARLAYETWGELAPARDNVVVLFTGLSPSAHAASSEADPTPGWWEFMIGPGRPIDTDRYHVICFNSLGSCFGSTGPASIDPATGRRYGMRFPELTIEDIAAAAHAALAAIGLPRVDTVIGASLGGMTALAFAVQFPEALDRLVTISSAAHALPTALAIRSLQREVIRNDPAWMNGDYETEPVEGMRVARKIGLLSYRSAVEWNQRFGRERVPGAEERPPFGIEFQVESYLEANARKFIGTFDANCYLYLSRAMDWFDLAEHGGTLNAAMARLATRDNLVVGVETDFLFPLAQQEEIADAMREAGLRVEFAALPSLQGHDAFLCDQARFSDAIGRFLKREARASGRVNRLVGL